MEVSITIRANWSPTPEQEERILQFAYDHNLTPEDVIEDMSHMWWDAVENAGDVEVDIL